MQFHAPIGALLASTIFERGISFWKTARCDEEEGEEITQTENRIAKLKVVWIPICVQEMFFVATERKQ